MYNPISTYRIQFNKDFTFVHLEEVVPYLESLGVKTIYASPIYRAVPGSNHGYDLLDPNMINPEIGDEEDLMRLIAKLQAAGIGWIQDIVPNHMAYHPDNPWLMDVLEMGPRSEYANFFDIPGSSDFFDGPLMVPFLGAPLEDVLSAKEISIVFSSGRLTANYAGQHYPLNRASYESILCNTASVGNVLTPGISSDIQALRKVGRSQALTLDWKNFQANVNNWSEDPGTAKALQDLLDKINKDPYALKSILDQQYYRLCDWKETTSHINFRRFFTVNGLICLNMDSVEVFEKYHETTLRFVREGLFNGIRVDHIDGLFDPVKYMQRLRQHCGEEAYIIVEKILEPNESLEHSWPVQGTSGYDFLALVSNLFTRNSAENKFSRFYRKLTGDDKPVVQKIHQKKGDILREHMGGELDNLHQYFIHLKLGDGPDESQNPRLREAIGLLLIHCPVYRFYGNAFPLSENEGAALRGLFAECKNARPDLVDALDTLEEVLLENPRFRDSDYVERAMLFYQRCMQFTGPLMAKGVEDTLMYTFNRFLGHNEVGDSPEFFGLSPADFHMQMEERQECWPLALNATSTHDTKRGEDARMRLNVLPDLADSWIDHASRWIELNEAHKTDGSPDANEEYFIYQTLISTYPMQPEDNYQERLDTYFNKAFREAKRHTDWAHPDAAHEKAVKTFVKNLLDHKKDFLPAFSSFQGIVSDHGIILSLAQLILKFTCPGVPDTYQGTSGWDLSLVDPDNRRQVDYDLKERGLDAVTSKLPPLARMRKLWDTRTDGRIKLWMANTLYHLRSEHAELFCSGLYIPLKVTGKYRDHCLAFARRYRDTWIITAVPLSMARIHDMRDGHLDFDWRGTEIILPEEAPADWKHVLLKTEGKHQGVIRLSEVFQGLPYALLILKHRENARKAGVLLSLTSLPSPHGIGDMGAEARAFADLLSKSGQRVWQLLPVTITARSSAHSPYSSYSSMAGNPLLISMDDLVDDKLLSPSDLEGVALNNVGKVIFGAAIRLKTKLLDEAWLVFRRQRSPYGKGNTGIEMAFGQFKSREAFWLDDFALYEVIRQQQHGAPWYEWPEALRDRKPEAMSALENEHHDSLEKAKFIQFLFFRQWKQLRKYCSVRNVELMGDIPLYVAYNSVDAWAHRSLFAIDNAGRMTGMAGVPPDYFNDDGQLWHMPVFNWDALKESGYRWWVERVRKNLELFDTVRLDHFRGFVDYWEVPAGASTAVDGTWKKGPGKAFFDALEQALVVKPDERLPLIAEDLGDISPEVFQLRDAVGLPGMKVLQFAFGDNLATSVHSPHNYGRPFVVYTGTHDNNTTRGWYREDLSVEDRERLRVYCNQRVNGRKVSDILIRMAYSSVADTAMVPMQDLLNLGEAARMNTPGTSDGNWRWRMLAQAPKEVAEYLLEITRMYNRL